MWRKRTPLCFTAVTNCTVKLTKNWTPTSVTLQYSTDESNWRTYTIGSDIALNAWWKIYFRNTSETDTWFSTNNSNYYKFVISWSVSASGDVTSLLNKNWTDTLSSSCLARLFEYNTWLTTPPELPSTNLASNCYGYMFRSCTWLTTAPELPATNLESSCYYSMFSSSWLITPPKLPATILKSSCYENMFSWCSSLTTCPSLPATTLASSCYVTMFRECTSLTACPSLPATTTYLMCYYFMFYWCTNLTTLPKLPTTSLEQMCYEWMFNWCTKIKLSTSQTGSYQTAYRIPPTWTGSTGYNSLNDMFTNTWWTFTWTPSINTTYYTSNTLV